MTFPPRLRPPLTILHERSQAALVCREGKSLSAFDGRPGLPALFREAFLPCLFYGRVGNRVHDRSRVAREEGYEVEYFANKHKINVDVARKLIRKHGNNRATLDAEVAKLRRAPR